MNDIASIVLKTVIVVTIFVITRYIIPCLKEIYNKKVDEKTKKMIKEAVEASEQLYINGSIKKKNVTEFASNWLSERGIKIRKDELDTLIESAVWTMNQNKS